MKFKLFPIFFILLSSNLYAKDTDYPPKNWWGEAQEINTIEALDDVNISEQLDKFINVKLTCAESKVKYKNNARIKSIPCEPTDNRNADFLSAIDSMRLSKSDGWKKLKSQYAHGDEIRSYSAPTLSGGFGYILIRKGSIIDVYEHGQQ